LHYARTDWGVEKVNIGAPMAGKRRRPRKISGIGIDQVLLQLKISPGPSLALWRTPANNSS
jgi:hypothetical protein